MSLKNFVYTETYLLREAGKAPEAARVETRLKDIATDSNRYRTSGKESLQRSKHNGSSAADHQADSRMGRPAQRGNRRLARKRNWSSDAHVRNLGLPADDEPAAAEE